MKLRVTISGYVRNKDPLKALPYGGTYVLAQDLVNGKAHWISEDDNYAIWYDTTFQNWKMGTKVNSGSSTAQYITLVGSAEAGLPHEIKTWQHWEFGMWTDTTDIVVEGKYFYPYA